jgi:hypothetical protein
VTAHRVGLTEHGIEEESLRVVCEEALQAHHHSQLPAPQDGVQAACRSQPHFLLQPCTLLA